MDVIEQYKQLKEKRDSLLLSLASEEASFKMLKEQYDSDLQTLYSTFNVKSLDEGSVLLSTKEKELSAILASAEAALASVPPLS